MPLCFMRTMDALFFDPFMRKNYHRFKNDHSYFNTHTYDFQVLQNSLESCHGRNNFLENFIYQTQFPHWTFFHTTTGWMQTFHSIDPIFDRPS